MFFSFIIIFMFSIKCSACFITTLIGFMGGAYRTFACKSQECLWKDWYILFFIFPTSQEHSCRDSSTVEYIVLVKNVLAYLCFFFHFGQFDQWLSIRPVKHHGLKSQTLCNTSSYWLFFCIHCEAQLHRQWLKYWSICQEMLHQDCNVSENIHACKH